MKTLEKIVKKPIVSHILIMVIGVVIGSVFYPSKTVTIEEKRRLEKEINRIKLEKIKSEDQLNSELSRAIDIHIQYKMESESKLSSLRTENSSLKQKVKERTLKIVKPDGTIVEETFKESQTEVVTRVITEIRQEFKQKVESIESKWKRIHESRVSTIKRSYEGKLAEKQKTINEYERRKTVEINKRNFGLSLGYLGSEQYFAGIQYDVFGPMFLDIHLDGNQDNTRTGVGLGIRF